MNDDKGARAKVVVVVVAKVGRYSSEHRELEQMSSIRSHGSWDAHSTLVARLTSRRTEGSS
jgi:hypothetical protein